MQIQRERQFQGGWNRYRRGRDTESVGCGCNKLRPLLLHFGVRKVKNGCQAISGELVTMLLGRFSSPLPNPDFNPKIGWNFVLRLCSQTPPASLLRIFQSRCFQLCCQLLAWTWAFSSRLQVLPVLRLSPQLSVDQSLIVSTPVLPPHKNHHGLSGFPLTLR